MSHERLSAEDEGIEGEPVAAVERGRSFIARTGDGIKETAKLFFSLPEYGSKLKNILIKANGLMLMGMSAKIALEQSWVQVRESLGAGLSDQEAYVALAAFAATGAFTIGSELWEQYKEKKWKEGEDKNKESEIVS